MSELAHPLWLLALALPLGLLWVRLRRGLQVPTLGYSRLGPLRHLTRGARRRLAWLPWALQLLAVMAGIVAMARPRLVERFEQALTEGVDIMLALDVSGSMRAEDFKPVNRLAVALELSDRFVAGRPHDRLGLVVFAGRAFTRCPLTSDHQVLRQILGEVDFESVEADGTAIGSALGVALSRLRGSPALSRVVVLLTDGSNNAGPIDPLTAAELARSLGVRVHAISVGTGGLVPYPVRQPDGSVAYEQREVPLDEETLRLMAEHTGGYAFRALDADSLAESFRRIDALEKSSLEVRRYSLYEERFEPWLLGALLLLLLARLLQLGPLGSLP